MFTHLHLTNTVTGNTVHLTTAYNLADIAQVRKEWSPSLHELRSRGLSVRFEVARSATTCSIEGCKHA